MKKVETFEEFVKKQEQKEILFLVAITQFAICSGLGTSLLLSFYPSELDWPVATIGYSLCGISIVILIWLIKKYDKPVESRYIKKISSEKNVKCREQTQIINRVCCTEIRYKEEYK